MSCSCCSTASRAWHLRWLQAPYRTFFLFAWCMVLLFIALWPLHLLAGVGPFPALLHAYGIMSLGLGSFAVGFLLTAFPRFTGTPPAAPAWVAGLLGLSVLEAGAAFTLPLMAARLIASSKFAVLLFFLLQRKRQCQWPLPPSLPWVPIGLLAATLGNMGVALCEWNVLPAHMEPVFAALFTRGFVISLFMGIGGRLMPILSGVKKPEPLQVSTSASTLSEKSWPFLLCALAYFAGIMIEPLAGSDIALRGALALQALPIAIQVLGFWKFTSKPAEGARARGLWVAGWMIVLGLLLATVFPAYRLHFLHLSFVAGFMLGTLLIASHVLVNHEGWSGNLLSDFWPLGSIANLVFFSALTRAAAMLRPSYASHLLYAAAVLLMALGLWGAVFIRRLVTTKG